MGYIKNIGAPDPPHQFQKPTPASALTPEAHAEGEAVTIFTSAQAEAVGVTVKNKTRPAKK